jgi:beta-phosphoglucomutase-like phosphatase (HAD superfamily)
MKPIVLFDVDGTLIRGSRLHIIAFRSVLKELYDIELPKFFWKNVSGKTDTWILHDLLKENGSVKIKLIVIWIR